MVPRRGSDHPTLARGVVEAEQRVDSPAHLERTRHLQVLALEPDLSAGSFAQRQRLHDRRFTDVRPDQPLSPGYPRDEVFEHGRGGTKRIPAPSAPSTHQLINSSTHQLINSSTHQLIN